MEERDYLAENAAYLKKDLGKNNISQNLFQRFKELITNGQLPAGYMMPNENVVSEQLGIGRSTLRGIYGTGGVWFYSPFKGRYLCK